MEWSQVLVLSLVIVVAQLAFNSGGGEEVKIVREGSGPVQPLTLQEVNKSLDRLTETEIKVAGNAKNSSGDTYLTDRGYRLDLRSCGVNRSGEVAVTGRLKKTVHCECVYKDRIYGWRNDSSSFQLKNRCLNNIPDIYSDSACLPDTETTEYYLACQ